MSRRSHLKYASSSTVEYQRLGAEPTAATYCNIAIRQVPRTMAQTSALASTSFTGASFSALKVRQSASVVLQYRTPNATHLLYLETGG